MLEHILPKIRLFLLVASDPRRATLEKSSEQTPVQNRVKQWQDKTRNGNGDFEEVHGTDCDSKTETGR